MFWKTQRVQWAVFTAFAAATFLILSGSFLALKRVHAEQLWSGRTIFIGWRQVNLPVGRVLLLIALGISLVIAVATGVSMVADECQLY